MPSESVPNAMAAIVLGGGHSRRFGREKGLAKWRSLSLVDHVLQRLPQPRQSTILVLRAEQCTAWADRDDVTIISDHDAQAGPLRGVIRGLEYLAEHSHSGWAWIVACDQPLVCTTLLQALPAAISPSKLAVIPEWEDRLQPLTGLYHVDAASELRRCHERGEASLINALHSVGHVTFSADQCRQLDPRGLGFMNVNRPADLDELERVLG